jgi:hypothetical protein
MSVYEVSDESKSSFLMDLRKDCHTCTDISLLKICYLAVGQPTCQDEKTAWIHMQTSLIRYKVSVQCSFVSSCISGILAGQASVPRLEVQHLMITLHPYVPTGATECVPFPSTWRWRQPYNYFIQTMYKENSPMMICIRNFLMAHHRNAFN